jgi:hypothetical protein
VINKLRSIFENKEGTKNVIWAKDIPNAKWLIGCKDLSKNDYVKDVKPYVSDKYDKKYDCYKVQKRPFWYYGRVYTLI